MQKRLFVIKNIVASILVPTIFFTVYILIDERIDRYVSSSSGEGFTIYPYLFTLTFFMLLGFKFILDISKNSVFILLAAFVYIPLCYLGLIYYNLAFSCMVFKSCL